MKFLNICLLSSAIVFVFGACSVNPSGGGGGTGPGSHSPDWMWAAMGADTASPGNNVTGSGVWGTPSSPHKPHLTRQQFCEIRNLEMMGLEPTAPTMPLWCSPN